MGAVLFVLHRSVGSVALLLIKPRGSLLGMQPDAAAAPFPNLTLRCLQERGSQVLSPERLPHRDPSHQIRSRLPSLKKPAGACRRSIPVQNQVEGTAVDAVKFLLKMLFFYKNLLPDLSGIFRQGIVYPDLHSLFLQSP